MFDLQKQVGGRVKSKIACLPDHIGIPACALLIRENSCL
jgi:hypothetical protein